MKVRGSYRFTDCAMLFFSQCADTEMELAMRPPTRSKLVMYVVAVRYCGRGDGGGGLGVGG